jgi:hypothetical protein
MRITERWLSVTLKASTYCFNCSAAVKNDEVSTPFGGVISVVIMNLPDWSLSRKVKDIGHQYAAFELKLIEKQHG